MSCRKRVRLSVRLSVHHHFGSDTITSDVFSIQLSYFIQKAGWWEDDTCTFGVQTVKGQGHRLNFFKTLVLTRELEYICSYQWQLSYFIHIRVDTGWWKKDTYTFWVQKTKVTNWTLSLAWFWHDNLSIFQHIFYIDTRMMRGHLGIKKSKVRVKKRNFVNTLVLTQLNSSFQHTPFIYYTSIQDGEGKITLHFRAKRSKFKWRSQIELCQHFGSDTITGVVSAHLSRRLKWAIVIAHRPSSVRRKLSHFRLLLWNRRTEFNETWQKAKSQRPLPSLCFSSRSGKQDGRPGLWLAETFSTSSLKPLNGINETWQEARSQRPLPSLCFSGRSEKQDVHPCLWLAEKFSTSPLKRLNGIQRHLTGSKISTPSTKFVFLRQTGKTRWPPWPLIGWDIFDFFSETAERN